MSRLATSQETESFRSSQFVFVVFMSRSLRCVPRPSKKAEYPGMYVESPPRTQRSQRYPNDFNPWYHRSPEVSCATVHFSTFKHVSIRRPLVSPSCTRDHARYHFRRNSRRNSRYYGLLTWARNRAEQSMHCNNRSPRNSDLKKSVVDAFNADSCPA